MTSLLGVPIILNGRILGDLYLTDKVDAAEFDEDDERLALLLARHAAVAIENANLNDELERRLEQVSSLREFGQAIGQELDVERALQLVVERAAELLNASLVAIALKDPHGDAYTFEAAAGRRARRLLGLRVLGGTSMIGWVAEAGHGAIVDDVAHDDRVSLRVLEAVGGKTGLWAPLPGRAPDRRLHHGIRPADRRAVRRGRPSPRRGDGPAGGRRRSRTRGSTSAPATRPAPRRRCCGSPGR